MQSPRAARGPRPGAKAQTHRCGQGGSAQEARRQGGHGARGGHPQVPGVWVPLFSGISSNT